MEPTPQLDYPMVHRIDTHLRSPTQGDQTSSFQHPETTRTDQTQEKETINKYYPQHQPNSSSYPYHYNQEHRRSTTELSQPRPEIPEIHLHQDSRTSPRDPQRLETSTYLGSQVPKIRQPETTSHPGFQRTPRGSSNTQDLGKNQSLQHPSTRVVAGGEARVHNLKSLPGFSLPLPRYPTDPRFTHQTLGLVATPQTDVDETTDDLLNCETSVFSEDPAATSGCTTPWEP
ncbi:uncharacterized protein LOC142344904 [Convolutriloba macropyga]|uniref:uncharacterized protein LOC142344904 n=1 Tax=Convolutriloba macropyga TaxID=536237 RepID=UPI003F51F98D